MNKIIVLFTIITTILVLFMFNIVQGASDFKIYEDYSGKIRLKDIQKEIALLKDKLGHMNTLVESYGDDTIEIYRNIKDKNEIITKIISQKSGIILFRDKYTIKDSLIWEHEEINTYHIHFVITVKKDGTFIKEDIIEEFPPTPFFTPVPTSTPTPTVTPAPTKIEVTPTGAPVKFKERIIFASDLYGSMDICTMNTDGKNFHRLTKDKYSENFPSISPDGKRVAYTSNQNGVWNIYTINLNKTGKKRITMGDRDDIFPLFINNNTILFQSFREGLPQLYTITLDKDRKFARITSGLTIAMHPSLYPDKNKIAFVGEKNRSIDIYSIDTYGRNLKQITGSGFEKAFPVISPDGKKIAFNGNKNGYWDIYILDFTSGKEKKIDTGFNESYCPSFTSDGKYIIFQTLDSGRINLYKINLLNNNIIKLTNNGGNNIQPKCQFISLP